MYKKNLLVGQSGGPTAVINSSLYGVVSEARNQKVSIGKIYGMVNGIEGFLADTILDFNIALPDEQLELLKTTPSSYLGTCRFKLPEDLNDPVYRRLFDKFRKMNIGYFFYIGGNDSMDTVSKLSRYARKCGSDIIFLGEPKTIDNDLVLTDHTPGFGSAARYVATTVREIIADINVYEKSSVTIIEIMGRHAGWLTAASVLARKYVGDNPMLIYLPEVAFDEKVFLDDVKAALEKSCNVVVCVSEGINDGKGTFICEHNSGEAEVDLFGHKKLTGCAKYLENYLRDQLDVRVRSIEFNLSQRCSTSMLSATDQREAVMAGIFGVLVALKGVTGKMISFVRESDDPYKLVCGLEDVDEICNKEKKVPLEWIIDGHDISDEFVTYAAPLIRGTVEVPMGEDGLPKFAYRK